MSRVLTNFNADGGFLGVFCGWWWAPPCPLALPLLILLRGSFGFPWLGLARTVLTTNLTQERTPGTAHAVNSKRALPQVVDLSYTVKALFPRHRSDVDPGRTKKRPGTLSAPPPGSPSYGRRVPQPQEPGSPPLASQPCQPSQASQAKVPKPKFLSKSCQAKVPKLKF